MIYIFQKHCLQQSLSDNKVSLHCLRLTASGACCLLFVKKQTKNKIVFPMWLQLLNYNTTTFVF